MGGFIASPPPSPEASKDEDDDNDDVLLPMMRMAKMLAFPVLTRCLLDTHDKKGK